MYPRYDSSYFSNVNPKWHLGSISSLTTIHIWGTLIGLINFGGPFKAGRGPNVQPMNLTMEYWLRGYMNTP